MTNAIAEDKPPNLVNASEDPCRDGKMRLNAPKYDSDRVRTVQGRCSFSSAVRDLPLQQAAHDGTHIRTSSIRRRARTNRGGVPRMEDGFFRLEERKNEGGKASHEELGHDDEDVVDALWSSHAAPLDRHADDEFGDTYKDDAGFCTQTWLASAGGYAILTWPIDGSDVDPAAPRAKVPHH